MVTLEQLREDLKVAMKAGDGSRKTVISGLISAIKSKAIEKRAKTGQEETLSNDEVMAVIMSEAKKRKESIEQFTKGGRQDLADQEKKELDELQGYLPEQLSDEALEAIVQEVITSVGATSMQDMGKIMGPIMAKVKGQADGNAVSAMVKKLLNA